MKQHIAHFLQTGYFCLAGLLPSAFAAQPMTVDLPFNFQVNNQQLPAGKYTVTADIAHSTVLLRSVGGKQAIYSLSIPVESKNTRENSTLVFRRYGDRYFLSQIWQQGSARGEELRRGAAEREVALRLARSNPKADTEVVAALAMPEVRK